MPLHRDNPSREKFRAAAAGRTVKAKANRASRKATGLARASAQTVKAQARRATAGDNRALRQAGKMIASVTSTGSSLLERASFRQSLRGSKTFTKKELDAGFRKL